MWRARELGTAIDGRIYLRIAVGWPRKERGRRWRPSIGTADLQLLKTMGPRAETLGAIPSPIPGFQTAQERALPRGPVVGVALRCQSPAFLLAPPAAQPPPVYNVYPPRAGTGFLALRLAGGCRFDGEN
jgi:hypothetical protein